MKVIDAVIKGALKLAGPIIRGVKGLVAKGKAAVAKGKAKLTGRGGREAEAAAAVAGAAARLAGGPNAASDIRARAAQVGNEMLEGGGQIAVKNVPKIQRTVVDVDEVGIKEEESPQPGQREDIGVRGARPTRPESAEKIQKLIESRMKDLVKEYDATPGPQRVELDHLETEFREFMKGRRARALTSAEQKAGSTILTSARSLSREYYEGFKRFAWTRLNKDPELLELVEAPDSGAKAGTGPKSLEIEVIVTKADGKTKSKEYRAVDFEHLTRVKDQPFRRHSEGGESGNLTPMLADLNRYYQEALRNRTSVHFFERDEILQFIAQHSL